MPEREAELHDTVRRGGVVDLGGQEWVLTRPLEIEFPVTLRNGTLAVETEAWWVSDDYAIHIEAPFAIQVRESSRGNTQELPWFYMTNVALFSCAGNPGPAGALGGRDRAGEGRLRRRCGADDA